MKKDKKEPKKNRYKNPNALGIGVLGGAVAALYGASKLLGTDKKKAKKKKEMESYKKQEKVDKFKSLFKM